MSVGGIGHRGLAETLEEPDLEPAPLTVREAVGHR